MRGPVPTVPGVQRCEHEEHARFVAAIGHVHAAQNRTRRSPQSTRTARPSPRSLIARWCCCWRPSEGRQCHPDVADWFNAMENCAVAKALRAQKIDYVCVLFAQKSPRTAVPPGCVLVDVGACIEMLNPFGASAVVSTMTSTKRRATSTIRPTAPKHVVRARRSVRQRDKASSAECHRRRGDSRNQQCWRRELEVPMAGHK